MPTRTWSGLILESRTEFGSAARKNRGRHAGAKVHRLHSEYVVGLEDGHTPHPSSYGAIFQLTGKPVLFSCRPFCGCTQGQKAGKPTGQTEADVTCEKCK